MLKNSLLRNGPISYELLTDKPKIHKNFEVIRISAVWNGGSVPAQSIIENVVPFTGSDDIGQTATINCNEHISDLWYGINITTDGTVTLRIANIKSTAVTAGNRTFTIYLFKGLPLS